MTYGHLLVYNFSIDNTNQNFWKVDLCLFNEVHSDSTDEQSVFSPTAWASANHVPEKLSNKKRVRQLVFSLVNLQKKECIMSVWKNMHSVMLVNPPSDPS